MVQQHSGDGVSDFGCFCPIGLLCRPTGSAGGVRWCIMPVLRQLMQLLQQVQAWYWQLLVHRKLWYHSCYGVLALEGSSGNDTIGRVKRAGFGLSSNLACMCVLQCMQCVVTTRGGMWQSSQTKGVCAGLECGRCGKHQSVFKHEHGAKAGCGIVSGLVKVACKHGECALSALPHNSLDFMQAGRVVGDGRFCVCECRAQHTQLPEEQLGKRSGVSKVDSFGNRQRQYCTPTPSLMLSARSCNMSHIHHSSDYFTRYKYNCRDGPNYRT
jgi:hypothetical protein